MSRQVKMISAPVEEKGDFGAYFPNALVAFFAVFKNSQELLVSDPGEGQYSQSEAYIEGLTYKVAYWPNPESRQRGYKPKPIVSEDSESNEAAVFSIDIGEAKYKQILESNGDGWELALKAVETHYRTEVVK